MRDFISIDIETCNPQRVSACAIGFARVVDRKMVNAQGYLIKPVGGHAPFQSKIHGITEQDTFDKPDFAELYPQIRHLFGQTLVAHSLFDQQVLRALSEHFGLDLAFDYVDTSALAKQKLPHLDNHRLKTLAKHYGLPKFRHHDAKKDAIACAQICLRLHEDQAAIPQKAARPTSDSHELKGMITGILADEEVNYKEAYELLYWLEDRSTIASRFATLHSAMKLMLDDELLDSLEAETLKRLLISTQSELARTSDA
jgi:DNA polymerase III subunit epsilon